ncbi:MAG: hypothetical protein EOO38_10655 [Cytophagaceae bacterium]|nr:MAG: hypothetical protein EOO38_10655 [Cytophagaceae bacterium]
MDTYLTKEAIDTIHTIHIGSTDEDFRSASAITNLSLAQSGASYGYPLKRGCEHWIVRIGLKYA